MQRTRVVLRFISLCNIFIMAVNQLIVPESLMPRADADPDDDDDDFTILLLNIMHGMIPNSMQTAPIYHDLSGSAVF